MSSRPDFRGFGDPEAARSPAPLPVTPFRPAPGLGNPHVQTILGKLCRPTATIPLRRERLETPDGDFVDLDIGDAPAADAPAVLVLHGLEGATSRRYMMNTFVALLAAGLRPVGLNFRGCSGEPNRTARAYHSGETEDVALVLRWLRDRLDVPLGVVGFSLGGNVTLKLLGERGAEARSLVVGAVAVSVPFDLAAGSDRIERGLMGRVYTRYFIRSLRRKIARKEDLLREVCDPTAIRRARTLRQFDEVATAPLHGFAGAAEYYERSSSASFIEHIRVPTLILHAEDDPFLPAERIPRAAMAANPWIQPEITRGGGHVGFIEGGPLRPRFWAETVLARWLRVRLGAAGHGRLDAAAAVR